MRRRAFSYLRWSKPEQGKGDSERRQSVAEDICRRKGWFLETSLRLRDEGVSAFRGRHRTLGALAAFLDAIREGRVKSGAVLIIEELDRLSREQIADALTLFIGILSAGISIYVVRTEREYTRENINEPYVLLEAIYAFILGHEESAKKSYRSRAWWEGRRSRGKVAPVTPVCPAWLRYDRGNFVPIPAAVETVRRIVEWLLAGYGMTRVTRMLVQENVAPIGRGGCWLKSYINLIAHNRQLLGKYQPHARKNGKRVPVGEPIPNYYPAVVGEHDFNRLQLILKARKGQTGPIGKKVTNLFTGLVRNNKDGGSMIICRSIFKGHSYYYLASTSSLEHGKGARLSVPYAAFEGSILRFLREITPEDLTAKHREDEIGQLEIALREKEMRIAAIQRSLEGDGDLALIHVLKNLDRHRKELVEKLEEAKARDDARSPITLQQTQSLIEALAEAETEELVEIRTRLRSRIKEFVASIDVRVEKRTRFRRLVYCNVRLHSGTNRGVWFSLTRKGLDDFGLWAQDGKFNGTDLDHFTSFLVTTPASQDTGSVSHLLQADSGLSN